jgi:glycosyltransferase involved in cell wall biosynthesis
MSRSSATGSKLLHVLPTDGIGGVEVAARAMLAAGLGDAFRVLLIAGRALVGSPHVIESRRASANNPLAHIAAVRTIVSIAPDVLVCSLWRSVPACVLAKLLRPRTRLVFFLHLDRPVHLPDRVMTAIGVRMADEIWSDSEETLAARPLPPRTPKRVVSFVTQWLEPAPMAGPPRPRFICWARIVPQKGLDRAIDLIGLLVGRGVDARFEIYGPDGGAQASLEQQVDELGLGQHVFFPGPVDHARLAGIAAENSFFLQLSRFEGMAMGVVEAMQLGLVPLVTPVGQIPHYVGPQTGLLIDPDDLPGAAARIAALLADPDAYARLRDGAIDHWRSAPLYADDIARYARDLVEAALPAS